MSKKEVEQLIFDAISKLNALDDNYLSEISKLKERIDYLEEKCSSQENMLQDSMEYIKKIEKDITK